MTAKTRRLRELLASGEFLYMPSAATPLEGRLAEAIGTPLVYTWGSSSRAAARRPRPRRSTVPLVWVQSRGNRDGRPILPLGELKEMGYRASRPG
jgi:hypothetical protein